MLQVKALGPCSFPGFHTLLRGESCEVPEGLRESAERLRKLGRLEFLEVQSAEAVAAEPSGNEAPAASDETPTAPTALKADEEKTVEELEAELASLEQQAPSTPAPQQPKRALLECGFCGKPYAEHVKGKPPAGVTRENATDCANLKALVKPKRAES